MKIKNFNQASLLMLSLAVFALLLMPSCKEEDPVYEMTSYSYTVHNGQAVAAAPYGGSHPTDFSANLALEELENGNTKITVTLNNTIDGATYHLHAHDAADAASTPNGTPYNETPNSDILAQMIEGNGSTVTITQEATMGYTELTSSYEGFFVVHDPLQAISTTDITSYLVVGGFARAQTALTLSSNTFQYAFNTGQLVADFAYAGTHSNALSASIQIDELAENKSRVTVRIMDTMDGETYHTHAHDMADAATTPNGTPYIESPNTGVFAAPIAGNGGTASSTYVSDMSYSDLTTVYDGFFVIHDPLQDLSTTNPTTYVVLGVFGR